MTHQPSFLKPLVALAALTLVAVAPVVAAPLPYVGVNLASGCFGDLPGTYNVQYVYPTAADTDYFRAKGMNTIRLPFLWERVQPKANGELVSADLRLLREFVATTTAKGMYVILDPHNFGKYWGKPIGTTNAPAAAFANLWSRLAGISEFHNNDHVFFNLMNEPVGSSTETWRDAANLAIAAIRQTGATNFLLVPGNNWTGAHSWCDASHGTPNATAMLSIRDPANNYAFDVHQYFDADSSGTTTNCVSPTIGAERLAQFTAWCRAHGRRGFLGEFGAATNPCSLQALGGTLAYMQANRDVWLGWTYWNAGPRVGEYMYTIEPLNGAERGQMQVLERFLPNRSQAARD